MDRPRGTTAASSGPSLTFLFFLGLAWLCARIVDLVISRLRVVLQRKHQTFSYSVLPLASRVLKLTILTLMAAAILNRHPCLRWGQSVNSASPRHSSTLHIRVVNRRGFPHLFGPRTMFFPPTG
jgi:hypothetical protein